MTKDNSTNLLSIVVNIIDTYTKKFRDISELAALETKLAAKTVVILAIAIVIGIILTISTWMSLLFLLFFYITSLNFSFTIAALIIASINILFLLILSIYI